MKASEVCDRLDSLSSERSSMEVLYDLIEQYVKPFSGEFYTKTEGENSVNWETDIFDATAISAASELGASIHGSLTPPLVKWLSIKFNKEELNEDQDSIEWLERATDLCYLALQESDFHLEINKAYRDLVSYGMAFITEESDDTGDLNFTTSPIKSSYFEEGEDGQPIRYYRLLNWNLSKIYDKFGDDCPADILKRYTEGKVTEQEEVIFCIYKNPDFVAMPGEVQAKQREWIYKYVYKRLKTDIGEVGGYYERPVFAPKWLENADSKFGVSPAMIAMPSILRANSAKRMELKAAEKGIDPGYQAEEDAILSDLDHKAGGLTIVKDIQRGIMAMPVPKGFDISQLVISDERNTIRTMFHLDDLQLKDSPAMTATETMARMELMQRVLGPTFGYLKSHLLDPIVERTFGILLRAGKFGDMPEKVAEMEGELDIEYLGTLARAQKRDEIDALQSYVNDIGMLMQIFPSSGDNVDFDFIARRMAASRNVPAEALHSKDEVAETREAREAAQQQQTELEQENLESNTAGNVAGAVNKMELSSV